MKITPKLEPFIAKLAAKGKSNAQIAKALCAKGVSISAQGVGQWLAKRRTDRATLAKVVTRDALAKTLTADLAALAQCTRVIVPLVDRVSRIVEATPDSKLVTSGVVRVLIGTLEQLRKQVETNLHYSGADQPDEQVDGLAGFLAMAFQRAAEDEPVRKAPTLQ